MAVFVRTPKGDNIELSWRERLPGIGDDHHLEADITNIFGITVDRSPKTDIFYQEVRWGAVDGPMVSLERNGVVCFISTNATKEEVFRKLHLLCKKF